MLAGVYISTRRDPQSLGGIDIADLKARPATAGIRTVVAVLVANEFLSGVSLVSRSHRPVPPLSDLIRLSRQTERPKA